VPELADIFRIAGPRYREVHAGQMLPSHHRAMRDIVACRTPALGGSLYRCDECDALDYRYHSCRNRHCPKCQEERAQAWLERTRARLLPCDHYLLTFTLPAQLRAVARANQTVVYAALLREAAASVQTLADDRQWVGGTLGILAVLHTWSRTLEYHPHAHLLVTAGGLSADGAAWIKPAHPRFLVPAYMLSEIFRAKLRDALVKASLDSGIDPTVWTRRWTVHVQQIGTGDHATRYLSRYIYRVALSNHSLERFDDGRVTFRYTHASSHDVKRQTLPVDVFIGRFLQHVLPSAFTKVRSYGLLSPTSRPNLERARELLIAHAARAAPPTVVATAPPAATLPNEATPGTDVHPTGPMAPICPVCQRGHVCFVGRFRRSRAPP
jgi:hypothetical protein